MKLFNLVTMLAVVGVFAGCTAEKTEDGNVTLPEFKQTKEGDVTVPKYDVDVADVDMGTTETTVTVPTVDVKAPQ